MSSSDEASVQGADFGPEGGERASGGQVGMGVLAGLALELEPPRSGEGEGGLLGQGLQSDLEEETIEGEERVLSGREGRPGSPAEEKVDALDFVPQLAVESAAIVQQLTGRQVRGTRRYPSPESCAAELSAIWGNVEAGPSSRGALAPSCAEAQQASATSLHASGPEGGRAWGNQKRGTKSRMMGSGAAPRPSSDQDSSDEFSELQMMRVSICLKEGAKAISPREQGETARHSNVHARESFLHTQGSLLTSAPRGLTSAKERQGELEASSSKKMQSVVWGKGGGRPSYAGAAAASASTTGDLPRASPKKKTTPEKKSQGSGSRVTLGRAFPSWGQRLKAAPLEPSTFPPISGIPLLGRAKRYSLLPLGSKQSKHGSPGKRPVAGKTRESQPVAREDNDPNREAVRQGQLLTHRPVAPFLCVDSGELRSVDPNARVPQPPGNSQPLHLSQGGLSPRSPAPSGDQESSVHPPVPERQQQAPGTQTCPRCVMLQKEIDELKEQLAILQSLAEKFQGLGN